MYECIANIGVGEKRFRSIFLKFRFYKALLDGCVSHSLEPVVSDPFKSSATALRRRNLVHIAIAAKFISCDWLEFEVLVVGEYSSFPSSHFAHLIVYWLDVSLFGYGAKSNYKIWHLSIQKQSPYGKKIKTETHQTLTKRFVNDYQNCFSSRKIVEF